MFHAIRICLATILIAAASGTAAQLSGATAVIQADTVMHNQEFGNVIAKGNVEISQEERVLFAASGNVILLEPTGDTFFADYVELTDGMRDGVIEQIRVLLTDDSRFAAVRGKRKDGIKTTLTKAVYSPCKVCKEDPEKAPLWQLKASTIVHDKNTREIRYQNARLELYGVPVAYTPFFSHPDPG